MKDADKDNYLVCYRLPLCRQSSVIVFSWLAVWNNNLYGDNFDLDSSSKELLSDLFKIISGLSDTIRVCFEGLQSAPGEHGNESKTIEDYIQQINNDKCQFASPRKFAARRLPEVSPKGR
jgi:hypothetical protein